MRRTPLKRTPFKPPKRTEVPKSAKPRKFIAPVSKTKKRRREQAEGDSMADLRPILAKRSGGRCEWCNHSLVFQGFEAHHRKFRSRGGKDEITNLVALCTHCHQRAHARALDAIPAGFSVLAHEDPAMIPIRIPFGAPVWLTPEGTYTRKTPEGFAS